MTFRFNVLPFFVIHHVYLYTISHIRVITISQMKYGSVS